MADRVCVMEVKHDEAGTFFGWLREPFESLIHNAVRFDAAIVTLPFGGQFASHLRSGAGPEEDVRAAALFDGRGPNGLTAPPLRALQFDFVECECFLEDGVVNVVVNDPVMFGAPV